MTQVHNIGLVDFKIPKLQAQVNDMGDVPLSTHKVLQDDRFDQERQVLLADVLLRGC